MIRVRRCPGFAVLSQSACWSWFDRALPVKDLNKSRFKNGVLSVMLTIPPIIVDFIRMMNSNLNMLGKFDELRTYLKVIFLTRKKQTTYTVLYIQYYARPSLTVNKIATLIISSRHTVKLGRGYIRVWNGATITILCRIIGS